MKNIAKMALGLLLLMGLLLPLQQEARGNEGTLFAVRIIHCAFGGSGVGVSVEIEYDGDVVASGWTDRDGVFTFWRLMPQECGEYKLLYQGQQTQEWYEQPFRIGAIVPDPDDIIIVIGNPGNPTGCDPYTDEDDMRLVVLTNDLIQ